MSEPKVRGNHLYCERHKGWFFSRKFAESNGEYIPISCPVCKRNDWAVVKVKRVKR